MSFSAVEVSFSRADAAEDKGVAGGTCGTGVGGARIATLSGDELRSGLALHEWDGELGQPHDVTLVQGFVGGSVWAVHHL